MCKFGGGCSRRHEESRTLERAFVRLGKSVARCKSSLEPQPPDELHALRRIVQPWASIGIRKGPHRPPGPRFKLRVVFNQLPALLLCVGVGENEMVDRMSADLYTWRFGEQANLVRRKRRCGVGGVGRLLTLTANAPPSEKLQQLRLLHGFFALPPPDGDEPTRFPSFHR